MAKIYGIDIYIHLTFILFISFLIFLGIDQYGVSKGIQSVVFILAIFLTVIIHELSHSIVGIKLGGKVRSILLLPIGGVSQMEKIPESPVSELKMTIAGPATNFIIAGLVYLFTHPGFGKNFSTQFSRDFIYVNLLLGVFNLLPAFPMDGGRILRSILAIKKNYYYGTKIAIMVGKILSLTMIFAGLFFNPWISFIGIFVFFGANAEERVFLMHNFLKNVKAEEVMRNEFCIVEPEETLNNAITNCFKQGANVILYRMEGSLFYLTKNMAANLTKKNLSNEQMKNIGKKVMLIVSPDEPAENIANFIFSRKAEMAAVMDNGQLKGVILQGTMSEYISFKEYMGSVK